MHHKENTQEEEQGLVPLSEAPEGARVVIVNFHGRGHFKHRLTSMGLKAGAELKVLSNSKQFFGGPIMVSTGDSRFGIGKGMSSKVLVRLIDIE